jgi:WD40 repeat protein
MKWYMSIHLLFHQIQDIFKEVTDKEDMEFDGTTLENENNKLFNSSDLSVLLGDKTQEDSSRYKVVSKPLTIQIVSNELARSKLNPKFGVASVSWSSCNKYIATRCDDMPYNVFVWSVSQLALVTVINQRFVIACCVWDPVSTRLALCTNRSKIYLWSLDGASWVDAPAEFKVRGLKWNANGQAMTLFEKDKACFAYLS